MQFPLEKLKSALLRRSLWEVLVSYFAKALGATSTFLLYWVIAQRLDPSEAGVFFLGLAAVMILGPASVLGIQMLGLRLIGARSLQSGEEAGEIKYLSRQLIMTAGAISCVVSMLFYLIGPIAAHHLFDKAELSSVFRWLSPVVTCMGLSLVFAHFLQGVRRFPQSIFVTAIGTQLGCAGLAFLSSNLDAAEAARLYFFSAVFNLLIATLFWRRAIGSVGIARNVGFNNFWTTCVSLWSVHVMVLIVNWSGLLVAGLFVASSEVASLSVAQRIANLVNFLLIGVNMVVSPRFARCYRNGQMAELKSLALKATFWTGLIAAPLLTTICVFSPHLMKMFGEGFANDYRLLIVLGAAQFFNVLTGPVNSALTMCELERELRNIVIASGILCLTLAGLLTWLMGISGTAWAIAISIVFQNALAVVVVRHRLGFSMFEAFRPTPRPHRTTPA